MLFNIIWYYLIFEMLGTFLLGALKCKLRQTSCIIILYFLLEQGLKEVLLLNITPNQII